MAASSTVIANMALSHIGAKQNIASLAENSTEANACNVWYDHSRLMCLEAYDWSFARKRLALTEDADDPPEGIWEFRYVYPSDCIRARHLENPTTVNQSIIRGTPTTLIDPDAIPFEVETADDTRKTILTDMEDAILVYTFNQTLTTMFPTHFDMTLSYLLAHNIAFTLTGKLSIKQEMSVEFAKAINQAAANDFNQNVRKPPRDADWIRGRW